MTNQLESQSEQLYCASQWKLTWFSPSTGSSFTDMRIHCLSLIYITSLDWSDKTRHLKAHLQLWNIKWHFEKFSGDFQTIKSSSESRGQNKSWWIQIPFQEKQQTLGKCCSWTFSQASSKIFLRTNVGFIIDPSVHKSLVSSSCCQTDDLIALLLFYIALGHFPVKNIKQVFPCFCHLVVRSEITHYFQFTACFISAVTSLTWGLRKIS